MDVLAIQYDLEEESIFLLYIQNSVRLEMYSYESKEAVQGKREQKIDFSNFPSGIYTVSIITPLER